MHPSWSKLWWRARALCLAAFVVLGASPARADEPSGDPLVERGLELRRARRDEEALAVFERAFDKSRLPMILAQIALAEQALGRFVEAEQHLARSLAAPDAWVEQRRAALETALGVITSRLAWLEVSVNDPRAQVLLDGAPRDLALSPFRVTAGQHEITVRGPDGSRVERTIVVRPGERHLYHWELPAESREPRLATVTASPPPALPPRAKREAPPARAGASVRTWAYASAAFASVALAHAIAASLVRESFIEDYNGPGCAPDRSQRCGAYRRAVNTLGTAAVVSYALAGAAGLTSLALFAEPWWNRPDTGPEGASVGFSGTF
jgi:tetratricopeptide (TPR) repeat protein